jgi:haloalkane dehalogenase
LAEASGVNDTGAVLPTLPFPDWLDRGEYPFEPHYFHSAQGLMHYVDEGFGEPLVFLHGNPTWSFMYRQLIGSLSNSFRCVAPDYIGFGLSEKPANVSYSPRMHAQNIESLIGSLGLEEITLVMHDWGGPIGMSFALAHPSKIKRLIVLNTWFWSLRGHVRAHLYSVLVGGPIGRFLCRQFNAFPRIAMAFAFANKSKLTRHLHRQYIEPFHDADSRNGTWRFVQAVTRESEWLKELWEHRDRLCDVPTLVLWAADDLVFGEADRERWISAFRDHRVQTFSGVGHFIAEEAGRKLIKPVEEFLNEGE